MSNYTNYLLLLSDDDIDDQIEIYEESDYEIEIYEESDDQIEDEIYEESDDQIEETEESDDQIEDEIYEESEDIEELFSNNQLELFSNTQLELFSNEQLYNQDLGIPRFYIEEMDYDPLSINLLESSFILPQIPKLKSLELVERLVDQIIDNIGNNSLDIDIEDVECCICLSTYEEKHVILNKIGDIKTVYKNDLFAGPCSKHFICYECLYKVSIDWENHPINRKHSLIRCMSYTEECLTPSGIHTYYNHTEIKKILSTNHYKRYIERANMYEFPGYEVLKCPSPMSRMFEKCNSMNLIPITKINSTPKGELIICCIQNKNCYYRYCYHCRSRIYGLKDTCSSCIAIKNNNDPNSFNKYIIKKNVNITIDKNVRGIDDGENMISTRIINEEGDYLYRNNEITLDMALDHIDEIQDADGKNMGICCPLCLEYFYKSERCSAIKHCGIERCYSCGRIQDRHDLNGLGDHWSSEGVNGCPRFDCDVYWNKHGECNFICTEEYYTKNESCYGHEKGECLIEEHQKGITSVNIQRKAAFVYHFIKSLLPELRNSIIPYLEHEEDIKNMFNFLDKNPSYINYYLPSVYIDKYNDYIKLKNDQEINNE